MRPIRRINRCSGKNQNGKCCKNKKMKYSDHCFVHSKNEDCCICYEPINSVKKLDCSHFFVKIVFTNGFTKHLFVHVVERKLVILI